MTENERLILALDAAVQTGYWRAITLLSCDIHKQMREASRARLLATAEAKRQATIMEFQEAQFRALQHADSIAKFTPPMVP